MLRVARWKSTKSRYLGTVAQFVGLYLKYQYLLHMSPQYGEIWPTSSWDRSASLGYPWRHAGSGA